MDAALTLLICTHDRASLLERVPASVIWLEEGFRRVTKNKGSPGIDGVTIGELESRLDEELGQLKAELELDLQTLTGAAGGDSQARWPWHPFTRRTG